MLTKMRTRLSDFLMDEGGPTAVEYAVMLSLIIVICFVAIQVIGTNTNKAFGTVGKAKGS